MWESLIGHLGGLGVPSRTEVWGATAGLRKKLWGIKGQFDWNSPLGRRAGGC